MKFLLCSIGTRGDMEPFLAIGDLLAKAGHAVICVMPAQFRRLVADTPHHFAPLDRRFMDLIDGKAGRVIMGQKGSVISRLRAYAFLIKESLQLQRNIVQEQKDYIDQFKPDRVICHPKCLFARVWGMKFPGRSICVSPVPNMTHPVSDGSHIGFAQDFGPMGNRLSFRFVNAITALMSGRYVKPHRAYFEDLPLNSSAILQYYRERERVLYLVSPSLVGRPDDWPPAAKIMGYFERRKTNHWQPPSALIDFIEEFARKKITFITFGSMVNDDPAGKTKAIIAALSKLKIPAIINTSSGGLQQQAGVPEHIHFVDNIPYEWIFPLVHSVVHHGGSGTTHTAIKYGCASLIIPHIIDQFYWNRKVATLGLGPLGIKIKKLTSKSFAPLISDLRTNSAYRKTAARFQARLSKEADQQFLLKELTQN